MKLPARHPLSNSRLGRIRLVVMDIDGTLVVGGTEIIDNVIEQLRRLKHHGIQFSVATGRTLHGARKVVDQLLGVRATMPPVIAYNGGVMALPDASTVLNRLTLEPETYRQLIIEARRRDLQAFVYVCQQRLDLMPVEEVYGEANLFSCPERDFNGMPLRWVEDLRSVSADVIAALLASSDPTADLQQTAEELSSKFGERLRITSSGGRHLEIAHADSTKLKALHRLARATGCTLDEVMAIGDNFNDLEMISGAGCGVAVANAPAQVRAAAKVVCERSAAEGVVEALRRLLDERRHHRIEDRLRGKRRGNER